MRLRLVLIGIVTIGVVAAAALWFSRTSPAPGASEGISKRAFVGRDVCARCHTAEATAWAGSHHDLAMQDATIETVLGDFEGAEFDDGAVKSRFFRANDRFMVHTDGPDGTLADFEVRYTFGADPLQQYLIALPGGRLQALSIAWDARPRADGGQRWFHLYPGERIRHDDPLHWTGAQQNWNYMCAECHSTGLVKNYDHATRSYATTWAEIEVSCEACHGPGSMHVEWAHGDRSGADRGLAVRLDERRDIVWKWDAAANKPVRSRPRETTRELDACAQCHARRGAIWPYEHGRPIGDTHRVALLEPSLYFADGQIRDEVYEYGSFLQSRMYHAGVTCSDCHEPHSLGLRAPGNGVCLQCHAASAYEAPAHHHHPSDTPGGACVACHMPTRTYMVVDPRHDHSLKIPRPDRSDTLGTPNACTACHADRTPAWATERLHEWFGPPPADDAARGIQRASALERLERVANDEEMAALRASLRDPDPLVRRGAVAAYESAPPQFREELFAALADAVRDVRLEAVPLLAPIPVDALSPEQQGALERGKREYLAAQRVNAERAEAHLNLGTLAANSGEMDLAEAELLEALGIDPRFAPAAVNLADVYRALDREADGERVLRNALTMSPDAAPAHHALGLLLVRTGRPDAALASLERAAALDPASSRYGYVYAVALADRGREADAITILEKTLALHPDDPHVQAALTTYRERHSP